MSAGATSLPTTASGFYSNGDTEVFLLDCMASVCFQQRHTARVLDLFQVLERILSNLLTHPKERRRYGSLFITGSIWTDRVAPLVYPLSLQAWLGCNMNEAGTHLVFSVGIKDDGPEAVGDEASCFIRSRLAEVHSMRLAWGGASQASEKEPSFAPASGVLLPLLRRVFPPNCALEVWNDTKRRIRLLVVQSFLSPERTGELTLSSSDAVEPFPPDLVSLLSSRAISLPQLEEDLCIIEAERFNGLLSMKVVEERTEGNATAEGAGHIHSPLPTVGAHITHGRERVAERHRLELLRDLRRDGIAQCGEAYLSLSQEEHRIGVSLIADIASLMEQVSIVNETQGLVREDRLEARRLYQQFKKDGDLVELHRLRDAWEDTLLAAKKERGVILVHFNA